MHIGIVRPKPYHAGAAAQTPFVSDDMVGRQLVISGGGFELDQA